MLRRIKEKLSHAKREIEKEIKWDCFAIFVTTLAASVYVVGKWDDYQERKERCLPQNYRDI